MPSGELSSSFLQHRLNVCRVNLTRYILIQCCKRVDYRITDQIGCFKRDFVEEAVACTMNIECFRLKTTRDLQETGTQPAHISYSQNDYTQSSFKLNLVAIERNFAGESSSKINEFQRSQIISKEITCYTQYPCLHIK